MDAMEWAQEKVDRLDPADLALIKWSCLTGGVLLAQLVPAVRRAPKWLVVALTGPVFPVSAAVGITQTISGIAPDRGNLNRRLAALRGLNVSSKRVVLGRGRPGTVWEWQNPAA